MILTLWHAVAQLLIIVGGSGSRIIQSGWEAGGIVVVAADFVRFAVFAAVDAFLVVVVASNRSLLLPQEGHR